MESRVVCVCFFLSSFLFDLFSRIPHAPGRCAAMRCGRRFDFRFQSVVESEIHFGILTHIAEQAGKRVGVGILTRWEGGT